MEKFFNPEFQEEQMDELISDFAEKEGMNFEDVLSDIVTFAPYEENESANPDYFDEVAERMGVPADELKKYAIKKAKEYQEV